MVHIQPYRVRCINITFRGPLRQTYRYQRCQFGHSRTSKPGKSNRAIYTCSKLHRRSEDGIGALSVKFMDTSTGGRPVGPGSSVTGPVQPSRTRCIPTLQPEPIPLTSQS